MGILGRGGCHRQIGKQQRDINGIHAAWPAGPRRDCGDHRADFGQPLDQFAFTDGFSFSIGGTSALLTILLAASIEEVGWRGYGEDSVAFYFSWFTESIIFGFVWAFWHLPLFWISGTYHAGLKALGLIYVLNFLISVVPMGFLTTWEMFFEKEHIGDLLNYNESRKVKE